MTHSVSRILRWVLTWYLKHNGVIHIKIIIARQAYIECIDLMDFKLVYILLSETQQG